MKYEYLVARSIDDAIAMACDAVGISTPSRWAPGRWVRSDVLDAGRSGRGDGAVMVAHGLGAAVAYNWHTSHYQTIIVGDPASRPDPATRRAWAEAAAAARREAEAEAERRHQRAAQTAASVWAAASDDAANHPYIISKGLSEHVKGVKTIALGDFVGIAGYRPQAGGDPLAGPLLVAPVIAADGSIRTLEVIGPDGRKAALAGGKRKCHFWAPDEAWRTAETVVIAEGVATALSALAALDGMDAAVIAALSAGNLEAAARAVLEARGDRRPRIVIAADLGDEGTPCAPACAAAEALGAALAAPPPPEGRDPRGWDLDDLRRTCGTAAVRHVIEAAIRSEELSARRAERQPYAGGFFVVSGRGVEWVSEDDNSRYWLCSELRILAATRNGSGKAWGRLLEWRDADGRVHRQALPAEMLQGDGTEVRRLLADGGLTIAPGKRARELLLAYLQAWRQDARARCVERCGWDGGVFVLPDGAIGAGDEPIVFQGAAAPSLEQAGSLDAWKTHVATLARGNSRLIFAIGVALAAPLLELIGEDSGGFHLRGESSCGKTTALRVAASVWARPEAYMRTWRATSNGLEAIAQAHNHLPLILDEVRQLAPSEAAEAAYLLGNGVGKSRANRNGAAREPARWRILYLSSGEIGLSDLIAQAGRRTYAGEAVRFADIAADAGAGFGLFEDCHGMTPASFAERLRAAASTHHGAVGREWLHCLVKHREALPDTLSEAIGQFTKGATGGTASGQVVRVARRFGLVAAALELATGWGLLPFQPAEGAQAVARVFGDWRRLFAGGGDDAETEALLAQVRAFIEAHGASRFERLDAADQSRVVNRVGFIRSTGGDTEFLVLAEAMRVEVCRGFDMSWAAKRLMERGILVGESGRSTVKPRIPGLGTPRCYRILASKLFAGTANDAT